MFRVLDNDGINSNKNIPGWRGNALREAKRGGHGGARVKKEQTQYWYHPDASYGMRKITEDAMKKWKIVNEVSTLSNEYVQACMDPDSVDVVDLEED